MAKTPEEKALDDVRKAALTHGKAAEKLADLVSRYEDALAAERRSARVLKYTATHPDLPEDFDLDAFLAADAEPTFADDPIETDQEAAAGQAAERAFQESAGADGAVPADATEESGEEEKVAVEKPKRTRAKAPEPKVDDDDPFGDIDL